MPSHPGLKAQRNRVDLVRIAPQTVESYKAIRLAALKSDPLSFGSTYEREALMPDAEWRRRANSLDGDNRIGYLALKDGEPCGLALCFRDNEQRTVGEIISVWVGSHDRRSGVGSLLLEAVRRWAEGRAIETLRLLVTSRNVAAIALYERNGFQKTGRTKPYPHQPEIWEIEMSRPTVDCATGEGGGKVRI
jgi:ribosomal protein S18 acetylase RimI-like enzyme